MTDPNIGRATSLALFSIVSLLNEPLRKEEFSNHTF